MKQLMTIKTEVKYTILEGFNRNATQPTYGRFKYGLSCIHTQSSGILIVFPIKFTPL